jgi:hypothetical protein
MTPDGSGRVVSVAKVAAPDARRMDRGYALAIGEAMALEIRHSPAGPGFNP